MKIKNKLNSIKKSYNDHVIIVQLMLIVFMSQNGDIFYDLMYCWKCML